MERFDRGSARDAVGLAALAATVTTLAVVGGRRREARATEELVERLHDASAPTEAEGSEAARVDLPDPVRRYLDTVLPGGRTGRVRVDQEGELRVGGRDSPWKPFTATHHATVHRPGFVWDATVAFLPLVSVRVRDAFVDGEGSSHVTLGGAVPFGDARPCPELNEAALQRYLAEAVWYPWALRPESGVSWEGLDDRTARATIECGGTTASLTFHFSVTGAGDGRGNDHGSAGGPVVERVHTERRYRAVDGRFEATPWTGVWRDYETRAGVRIPTEGEVVWHLSEGDVCAWRGRVRDVEYRE